MSTTANPAIAAVPRSAGSNAGPHASKAALGLFAGRLASRLKRFLDGLPERHGDVDVQVLKQVPTPI
jgi:hypothetical protein